MPRSNLHKSKPKRASFQRSSIPSFRSPIRPPPRRRARHRHRHGKVARLPAATRHRLNTMLLDGLPYSVIIQRLGKSAPSIIEQNISQWRKGGYLEWLANQQQYDGFAARLTLACDFVKKHPHANIHEASLQIAVSQILDLLARLNSAAFKTKLQNDPQFFIRLLNSLPKLTRGGLQYLRQRLKNADHKSKSKPSRRSKLGLTSETRQLIEDQFNLFPDTGDPSCGGPDPEYEI